MNKGLLASASLAASAAVLGVGLVLFLVGGADADEPIADMIRGAAPAQPPEVSAALAGGTISYAEREAASARVVNCMAQAGIDVIVQPGEGLRPTRFGFKAAGGGVANADAVLAACKEQHFGDIDRLWAMQQQATGERASEGRRMLAACLAQRGVEDTGETVDDARMQSWLLAGTHIRELFACSDEIEAQTGSRP